MGDGGGGGFMHFTQTNLRNPYLKILDFSKHFVLDAPIKNPNFRALCVLVRENRPLIRGLRSTIFLVNALRIKDVLSNMKDPFRSCPLNLAPPPSI